MARRKKSSNTKPRPRRLSIGQVAIKLGLHPQTVRSYIEKGYLRAMVTPSPSKFGRRFRILDSDLDKFVARHLKPHRIATDGIKGLLNPVSESPNEVPVARQNSAG